MIKIGEIKQASAPGRQIMNLSIYLNVPVMIVDTVGKSITNNLRPLFPGGVCRLIIRGKPPDPCREHKGSEDLPIMKFLPPVGDCFLPHQAVVEVSDGLHDGFVLYGVAQDLQPSYGLFGRYRVTLYWISKRMKIAPRPVI